MEKESSLKRVRARLHRFHSSYQTKGKKKRGDILEELKKDPNNIEVTNKLLSTMISTKERLPNYKTLYNQIFKITGKPKTIIDLGCAINPTSFPYMNLSRTTKYYGYDIDTNDIKFVNNYFKIMKIEGKAKILDVRETNKLKKLPNSDIILMFKLYDLIVPKNKKKKKIGEEIINILINKTNHIIVSFPTKTLTRKPMNLPKRIGFEMMLARNQLKFEFIKTDNEIFYVINNPYHHSHNSNP